MTVPEIIYLVLLGISALICVVDDFRRSKVKTWMTLLLVSIGIIGCIIIRAISGTMEWWFLIPIPLFYLAWFFNTRFNSNRFIGQADVDILCGSIAMFVPIIMTLLNEDFGYFDVNIIHITDFFVEVCLYILIGYIATLAISIIRMIVKKVQKKNVQELDKVTENPVDHGSFIMNVRKLMLPVAVAFMPLFFYTCLYACWV